MIRSKVNGATIDRFDGPADFSRTIEAADLALSSHGGDPRWCGGTRESAFRQCISGDLSLVDAAERMLDKLSTGIETPRPEWSRSIAGTFVSMPDFIAGHPECMRRKTHGLSDANPIKVYVDLVSSGSIDSSMLRDRGVAILALTMALTAARPTELIVVMPASRQKNAICLFPIPTQPLDLSVACAVFTNGAVTRSLGYSWLSRRGIGTPGDNLGWYRGTYPSEMDKRYEENVRADIGAAPGDLYIPAPHGHDPIINDPVAFIQRTLTAALEVSD